MSLRRGRSRSFRTHPSIDQETKMLPLPIQQLHRGSICATVHSTGRSQASWFKLKQVLFVGGGFKPFNMRALKSRPANPGLTWSFQSSGWTCRLFSMAPRHWRPATLKGSPRSLEVLARQLFTQTALMLACRMYDISYSHR